MKRLFFLQLFFVFLLSVQVQSYNYTVAVADNSSPPAVVGGYAQFSGTTWTTPCQPNLPGYWLTFLLPPDANIDSVSFSIFDTVTTVLAGVYSVRPVPPITTIDSNGNLVYLWPSGLTIVDGKDMAIYGNNAYFPASHFGNKRVGMGRQYKLADLSIYPYIYNPVSGKLNALVAGRVQVNFATIPGFVVTIPRSEWYEAQIRDEIDNDTTIFRLYEPSPAAVKSFFTGTVSKKPGETSMLVWGNQFAIPSFFPGAENLITVFDLTGKRLYSVTTKEQIVTIREAKAIASENYIVKIKPLK